MISSFTISCRFRRRPQSKQVWLKWSYVLSRFWEYMNDFHTHAHKHEVPARSINCVHRAHYRLSPLRTRARLAGTVVLHMQESGDGAAGRLLSVRQGRQDQTPCWWGTRSCKQYTLPHTSTLLYIYIYMYVYTCLTRNENAGQWLVAWVPLTNPDTNPQTHKRAYATYWQSSNPRCQYFKEQFTKVTSFLSVFTKMPLLWQKLLNCPPLSYQSAFVPTTWSV
jgi:hypothetical protein